MKEDAKKRKEQQDDEKKKKKEEAAEVEAEEKVGVPEENNAEATEGRFEDVAAAALTGGAGGRGRA